MNLCEPRNIGGVFGSCGWCGAPEGAACTMLNPSAEVRAARLRLADPGRAIEIETEAEPRLETLEDEARLWRPRAPAERRPLRFRPVGRPMGSVGPHASDKRPMEIKVQEALARLEADIKEIAGR